MNEDTDSLQLAWKDTAQPDIPVLGKFPNLYGHQVQHMQLLTYFVPK